MEDSLDRNLSLLRDIKENIETLEASRREVERMIVYMASPELLYAKYDLKKSMKIHMTGEFIKYCALRGFYIADGIYIGWLNDIKMDTRWMKIEARVQFRRMQENGTIWYPFQPDFVYWIPVELALDMKGE